MQKTILSKVIAVILLLSLLLPTFGTTVIAVVEEVEINQANLKTSTRFVDANMAFLRGDESLEHVIADVGEEDLKFRLYLDLKDEGYFRGGEINILSPENLTYEFVTPETDLELINYVDSQTILLNQIKGTSETFIEIPLRYTGADNIDSKDLLNKNDFELKGEYTNSQGRKYDVYKRTNLSLNWVDNKEVEISNKVQKYIKYEVGKEKGVVIQNLITVSNKEKEINLPIQKVSLETNLLKLNNKLPKSVNVSVQNAKLLNDEENLVLDKKLFNWNEAKNNLKIEVESAKNKDDTYSAGNGNLEILVTSFYEIDKDFTTHKEEMKLFVKEYVLTGNEQLTEVQKENITEIVLNKEVGKLVDTSEVNETTQLPKGILYVNTLAGTPTENLVKSKMKLEASNVDIIDYIKIVENEPQYNNGLKENNLIYKTIEINKKAFTDLFGNGYIGIYSGNKFIGNIDKSNKEVNGKLVFEFKDKISNINIVTSKPEKEGEVFLEFNKVLNKPSYNIESLKNVKALNLSKKSYVVLNNEEKLINELAHGIKLIDGLSSLVVNTNVKELSTIKKNENVEFVLSLNNDKVLSDVYGQTVIEMVLPKGIKEFSLKNTSLLHGGGLKISSSKVVKAGTQYVVQIVLSGTQNGISKGHLTNGTSIVLNTDIILDQWSTSKDANFDIRYSNALATNYRQPVQWGMSQVFSNFAKFGNGHTQGTFKFVAPKGLVLINEFEKYNKKNESVISINQGYKEGTLDILSGKRVVEGTTYLLNNSEADAVAPSVLGRIPNKLNKNIFSNESLGSTFDAKLVKPIETENGTGTIYYSNNPNATNDLNNVSNGWSIHMTIDDVKSYLVVFDQNISKGQLVKINYAIEIPENLEHNQQIQTYSLVEFGIPKGDKISRYYQMASPVALSTGEGVQLDINIKADKNKIAENEDITYTLNVANRAIKTDAKNVESFFKIPKNLEFKGIKDTAVKTALRFSKDNSGVYITLGDIKAGNSISKDIVFTAKEVKNEEEIELVINTAADNFKLVKTEKAIGSQIEGTKLSIVVKDLYNEENPTDRTRLNIYPNEVKYYEVKVLNNTGYSFDDVKKEATYGDIFGKVNLTVQIPSALEYVETENSLVKVLEYNKITNVLKLQVTSDELLQEDSVTFYLPLKVKNSLPMEYDREVKLSVLGTTITKNSKENITSQSNVLTNYIANTMINDELKVYKLGDSEKRVLTEIQEFDDIILQYTLNPTYNLLHDDFEFEAPKGVIVKGIYTTMGEASNQTSFLVGGKADEGKDKHIYKYPIDVFAYEKFNIYVHLHVEGIEEASSKTLSYKIGTSKSKQTKNLIVRKGNIQEEIKNLVELGNLHLSPSDQKKYGIGTDAKAVAKNSVLGKVWLDKENKDYIGRVNVELIDNETKKVVAKTVSDEDGRYQFDNVINGDYSVLFKYNEEKYLPTAYNDVGDAENNSIGLNVNLGEKIERRVAVTDGIQVNFASVRNVDLGLVEKESFDLSLSGEITEIEVVDKKEESKTYNFNDRQNVKLELDRALLDNSNVSVKYMLRVKNEGKLEGNVLRIKASLPKGMNFIPEKNKAWELDGEGNLYTNSLSVNVLEAGKSLSIPLVLEADFNKENIGMTVLEAEIVEASNNLGLSNKDFNRGLDSFTNVELILGLNTGKKVAYTLLLLTTLAVAGSMIFLVLRKVNGKEIK